jgi:hypothetical protein
MSTPSQHGYLDVVMQSHIHGWAAAAGHPARPIVSVNGREVGQVTPNVTRPDLPAHGFPAEAGFNFNMPEPLGREDVLSVTFADGTHLGRSPSTAHQPRLCALFDGIDFGSMAGIELGPLDKPLLSKRRARVCYVDRVSREELVEEFSGALPPEAIREVDIVWRDGSSLAECAPRLDYDFCLASHVIEHAPDTIGWLNETAEVLREGGLLNLAVPDKTRTFDRRREPTTVAQFIGWHMRKIKIPAPEQIFDCTAFATETLDATPRLGDALLMAQSAASGQYLNTHCSVFTQESFRRFMAALAQLRLTPYRCRRFFPTVEGANEFIVSLQKDSQGDPSRLAESFAMQPKAA